MKIIFVCNYPIGVENINYFIPETNMRRVGQIQWQACDIVVTDADALMHT